VNNNLLDREHYHNSRPFESDEYRFKFPFKLYKQITEEEEEEEEKRGRDIVWKEQLQTPKN